MEQIQITIQPQNNNLNYLINPTFTNANGLFVLSFQRIAGENNTIKDSFSRYYVPNARIKDFNEMSNNNDYTTGNLLDFVYFKENYKLIAIDLSKQTKLKDPQQIIFIGKLLNTHRATMFFIIEKLEETTLNFSQNSVAII